MIDTVKAKKPDHLKEFYSELRIILKRGVANAYQQQYVIKDCKAALEKRKRRGIESRLQKHRLNVQDMDFYHQDHIKRRKPKGPYTTTLHDQRTGIQQ